MSVQPLFFDEEKTRYSTHENGTHTAQLTKLLASIRGRADFRPVHA